MRQYYNVRCAMYWVVYVFLHVSMDTCTVLASTGLSITIAMVQLLAATQCPFWLLGGHALCCACLRACLPACTCACVCTPPVSATHRLEFLLGCSNNCRTDCSESPLHRVPYVALTTAHIYFESPFFLCYLALTAVHSALRAL